MLNIRDIISGRLKNQGLSPIEITRLIKDVSNIKGGECYSTTNHIKFALERLGWERYILDNYTLELIFLYLDDKAKTGFDGVVMH